jgi:hypothetical protein
MIEKQLVAILMADAAVQAIAGARIYPMRRPQDDPAPCVVYQRISTAPVKNIEGDSGLDSVRLQVSCWATAYADAKALAAAVRSAINASDLKSATEMEMDDQDAETREFRVMTDYRIWQNL